MGSFSIWHWLIVLAIILILFDRGRIANVMGDFGQGLRAFRRNSTDDDKPEAAVAPPPAVDVPPAAAVPPVARPTSPDRPTS